MFDLIIIANGLVAAGIVCLAASLFRIRKLTDVLPDGNMQSRWRILAAMVGLFILGYIAQVYLFWDSYENFSGMIVPIIFFCGACFVWTVCALALQTTLDLIRVLRENNVDPLTQIYNRRFLDERLTEEVNRAVRYEMPLSVLMLDIDHFKSVNDTYGHQAGDLILSEFGNLISSVVRDSDIVARYGGEEFLVLTPGSDEDAAGNLANRIRERTQERQFVVDSQEGPQTVNVTVSVGVAQLRGEINTHEKLVKSADEALYSAKRGGRNRVSMNSIEILQPVPA